MLSLILFLLPVAILGNCADIASCKLYCEQPQNRPACEQFRKEKMASEAKTFLGCSDYNSCKSFCQIPQNHEKCSQFATSRAPTSPNIITAFYQATKEELGCDSETSCRAFCDLQPNFVRCTLFAKRHNLFRYRPGPPVATPSGHKQPTNN